MIFAIFQIAALRSGYYAVPATDQMNVTGDDRDRQARFIVRAIGRGIEDL
jgi:hypothetical protein